MFNEAQGEKAQKYHDKIKDNELKRRALLAENIAYLSELKDKNLFRILLGDEQAPWSAYLSQVEVYYSRNQISNLVAIHNKFIKELNYSLVDILDIPTSRLYDLVSIDIKDNVNEWLEKARQLPGLGWQDAIRVAKGKQPSEECQHKFIGYDVCGECGFRCKNQH